MRKPHKIIGNEAMTINIKTFLYIKKLNISFRKKTITAKKEPMCKLTLSIKSSLIKCMNFEKRIICEEELIGRNSVIP